MSTLITPGTTFAGYRIDSALGRGGMGVVFRATDLPRIPSFTLLALPLRSHGDISPVSVPIVRITGRTPPRAGLPSSFQGAVIDRVFKIPPRLMR